MQLDFCRTQLQQKEKELGSNTSDYVADQNLYNKAEIEVKNLEVSVFRFVIKMIKRCLRSRRLWLPHSFLLLFLLIQA